MLHLTRQITQRGTLLRILRGEVHVLKYKLEPLCRQNPSMSSPRRSRSRRWIWRGVRARARTPRAHDTPLAYRRSLALALVAHVALICHLLRDHLGLRQRLDRVARILVLIDLNVDPVEGVLEALAQRGLRRPPKHLLDQRVVRVAAAHALGAGDVLDGQFATLKTEDDVGHLVHRDHLVGADVERLLVVGDHQSEDTLHAVVNVAEGARLHAIAPHLELLGRRDGFAAESSWRLLAAPLPRAAWAVDVVEAAEAALHAEVRIVVHQQLLGHQLLEAVRILGLSRPGVVLLEAGGTIQILTQLLALRVDARARRIPEALDSSHARGLGHVEADHRRVVEDARMVALDEAHTAHVRRQVEAPVHARDGLGAGIGEAQVEVDELVAELLLLHVLILLPVDGTHKVTLGLQAPRQVGADEATRAGDKDLAGREALSELLLRDRWQHHLF